MTEPVTVKLSKPIIENGEEVLALTFHEATVGDMIAGDEVAGDFGKTIAILASMSGVSYEAFKTIRAGDIGKVTAATKGLLGNVDTPKDSGSD